MRKCALELHDERLLAEQSAGDIVTNNVVYYAIYLAELSNRAAKPDKNPIQQMSHETETDELTLYIKKVHVNEEVVPIFKLTDLINLYRAKLRN